MRAVVQQSEQSLEQNDGNRTLVQGTVVLCSHPLEQEIAGLSQS